MTEVVSDKLLKAHRERAVSARTDKMFAALRAWRDEIVQAMAERIAEIGDAPDDAEILVLCREFRLWSLTAASLHADPASLIVVDPYIGSTPR